MSIRSKIGITIFLVLFVTYAFFPQKTKNDNVQSRIILTLSMVEDRTLTINKFHRFTDDLALYNGNYYSDKAPGMAFSALPIVVITRAVLQASGDAGPSIWADKLTPRFGNYVYWSTLFTSGLMTALAALGLYFLALRIGATTGGAIFAALAFGLATPAWGWATFFFGHAVAGACLFLGFAAVFYWIHGADRPGREVLLGFLAGALLSWAVVVEFTALPAAIIIAAYGATSMLRWPRNRFLRGSASAVVGAILFSIPLLGYNAIVFDSPLRVGYGSVPGFEGMHEGFFGLGYPQVDVLYRLIFPQYRGILWYAPVIALAPIAIYVLWRSTLYRGTAIAISLIAIYYFLMNASYYYWDGGGSTGPRHLTPMLPFLCLPLAVLWSKMRAGFRPVLLGLFALSFLVSFISVAVDMASPSEYHYPLYDYLIPEFLKGNIVRPPFAEGLQGHAVLIPLFLIWAAGFLYARSLYVRLATAPAAPSTGGLKVED
jgi:hypothetical protein